jgi:hypothetical protein
MKESGLGFSPFGIHSDMDAKGPLADTYLLDTLDPLILQHKQTGDIYGFVVDRNLPSVDFNVN